MVTNKVLSFFFSLTFDCALEAACFADPSACLFNPLPTTTGGSSLTNTASAFNEGPFRFLIPTDDESDIDSPSCLSWEADGDVSEIEIVTGNGFLFSGLAAWAELELRDGDTEMVQPVDLIDSRTK
jgi:hypothetical protein